MATILLSPNPGAEDVASDMLPFLIKNGKLPPNSLRLLTIKDTPEAVEKKVNELLVKPVAHLFVVEQFCMPSPLDGGGRVIVYRTTIRIGERKYVASCYTNTRAEAVTRFANLLPGHFETIMNRVGSASRTGTWQQLLKEENLLRFRFF